MELLYGAKARNEIESEIKSRLSVLSECNEHVRIVLFRVGERDDDCQYERTILHSCSRLGIDVEAEQFSEGVTEQELSERIRLAAERAEIDGILLFRPLPKHLHAERITACIPPEKDIDGARLSESDFVPCTPEACMRLLRAYGIDVFGKNCAVIGRSPVVGKPLAELLRKAGAVVSVCHTQTPDVPAVTRQAELLFAACGKPRMVDRAYLSEGQVIVDVGFHAYGDGFCGDVNEEDAAQSASFYTPVPGGVGAVTLSILLLHAVQAHERKTK